VTHGVPVYSPAYNGTNSHCLLTEAHAREWENHTWMGRGWCPNQRPTLCCHDTFVI